MADVIIGNNINMEVQQAIGPVLTVSAVTQANPGVCTFTPDTSGSPAIGDVVVFTVTDGMDELDGQACRVLDVDTAGTSFTLEGIDTTDFDDFVSGTVRVVEEFAPFAKSRTVSAPNAEPPEIDITTLKDKRQKIAYGLPGAIKGAVTALFNPGGTTEALIISASEHQSALALRLTYADGRQTVANAKWAFGQGFSLAPNSAAESNAAFTPLGAVGMVHYSA